VRTFVSSIEGCSVNPLVTVALSTGICGVLYLFLLLLFSLLSFPSLQQFFYYDKVHRIYRAIVLY